MKYTITVEIKAPRQKVVEHFQNEQDLPKWQPEMISIETLSGEKGQKGAKAEMKFKFKNREVTMLETILDNNLPETFDAYYEAKGAKNWVRNTFRIVDENTTRWQLDSEFKCSGMLKLMAWIFPSMFKNATTKSMNLFKQLAEGKL